MDLALYDSRFGLLRPRSPTFRARGRFFYQRRRRSDLRRAARDRRSRRWRASWRKPAPPRSIRSRRGRRRQRPACGRHPARGAPERRDPVPPNAAPSGRIQPGGARRAAHHAGRRCGAVSSRPPTRCQKPSKGCSIANELLDAMPVHQVVMRAEGLREVYVTVDGGSVGHHGSVPCRRRHSAAYFDRLGVALEEGWRVEVNLRARDWIVRRRAPAAAGLRHPDRLRPRGAGAVLGGARDRHADDV